MTEFRDEVEATAWAGFMASALGRMSSVTACERDADAALAAMRMRRAQLLIELAKARAAHSFGKANR